MLVVVGDAIIRRGLSRVINLRRGWRILVLVVRPEMVFVVLFKWMPESYLYLPFALGAESIH